jgi:hypothetical protein
MQCQGEEPQMLQTKTSKLHERTLELQNNPCGHWEVTVALRMCQVTVSSAVTCNFGLARKVEYQQSLQINRDCLHFTVLLCSHHTSKVYVLCCNKNVGVADACNTANLH